MSIGSVPSPSAVTRRSTVTRCPTRPRTSNPSHGVGRPRWSSVTATSVAPARAAARPKTERGSSAGRSRNEWLAVVFVVMSTTIPSKPDTH